MVSRCRPAIDRTWHTLKLLLPTSMVLLCLLTLLGCSPGRPGKLAVPHIPESLGVKTWAPGKIARMGTTPPESTVFVHCAQVVTDYNTWIDNLVVYVVPYLKDNYAKLPEQRNTKFTMLDSTDYAADLSYEELVDDPLYNVKAVATYSKNYTTEDILELVVYFNTATPNWDYTYNQWEQPGNDTAPHWMYKITYDEQDGAVRTRSYSRCWSENAAQHNNTIACEMLVKDGRQWVQFSKVDNFEQLHFVGVANLTEGKPLVGNLEYYEGFVNPFETVVVWPALQADPCNTALMRQNAAGNGEIVAYQVMEADITGEYAIYPPPSAIELNPLPWTITYDDVANLQFNWDTLEML